MKTRNALIGFLAIITLTWAIDALWLNPIAGSLPWVVRRQGIYLTGLWAIALMSLVMVLATRPVWLENSLGGMDKIYRLHKWAGIWAILFSVLHWVLKLGGSTIASNFGTEGKPIRDAVIFFFTSSRSIAKDLGEWSIYILIALLIIALWKRIPYKPWRILHKAMPVIYLVLVFHTVALTPLTWWLGFTGTPLAIMLIAGTIAAFIAISNKIGKSHKHLAYITAVNQVSEDVLEVVCNVGSNWNGHTAGQFAFVTFDESEGAHPFTIASSHSLDNNKVTFQIKALGDYTCTLASTLYVGQSITIEGPYGRLNYKNSDHKARQIWVAGGIGITPFLAWLEDMQTSNFVQAIEFHYCTRNASKDPFTIYIQNLCANLPNVQLYIHDSAKNQSLNATKLHININKTSKTELWFCGPQGFANSLRNGFKALGAQNVTFHQEAFDMR